MNGENDEAARENRLALLQPCPANRSTTENGNASDSRLLPSTTRLQESLTAVRDLLADARSDLTPAEHRTFVAIVARIVAIELDAIPPDKLIALVEDRIIDMIDAELVEDRIIDLIDAGAWNLQQAVEDDERELLRRMAGAAT